MPETAFVSGSPGVVVPLTTEFEDVGALATGDAGSRQPSKEKLILVGWSGQERIVALVRASPSFREIRYYPTARSESRQYSARMAFLSNLPTGVSGSSSR